MFDAFFTDGDRAGQELFQQWAQALFGESVCRGDEVAGAFVCDVGVGQGTETRKDFGARHVRDEVGDVAVLLSGDHACHCIACRPATGAR